MKTVLPLVIVLFILAPSLSAQDTNKPDDQYQLDYKEVFDNYHYNHPYRPQFHYTPITGHIGDATGMIYYKGQYHLFHMFDPWSLQKRENKNWGHAVSSDALYWEQKPPILNTVIDNRPGSGSGVVDWNNSSGLRNGPEKTLVVFYTDYKRGTCISFSNDAGKTWLRHKKNPVLGGFQDIRDPYVFWYKYDKSWRMVRYEKRGAAFYKSDTLLDWTYLSRTDGFFECIDFMELAVDGDQNNKKWVIIDGNGTYFIGSFDGNSFRPESERLNVDYSNSKNERRFYATQTWRRTPECDEPLIQMAFLWDRPPKKDIIWSQQMVFPCEVSLKTFTDGIRLCRYPIREIKNLRYDGKQWSNLLVEPGDNPLKGVKGDVFEITAQIDIADANGFEFDIRGQKLTYSVKDSLLMFDKQEAPVKPVDNIIKLKILIDRCSVEIFSNDGDVTLNTIIYFPDLKNLDLGLSCQGGSIKVIHLEVYKLESIWLKKDWELGHNR